MMKKAETKKTVKATPITITVRENGKIVTTKKATSVCNMWKLNKELFKEHPSATLYIKKDGQEFMKLHLITKANGKVWMKNDIEASRRKAKAKTVAEDEVHTISEAAEQTVAETTEEPVFAEA